ncbi:MAG: YtxH domain-containing protein [Firmicutes bacterium]|nr:YtxH domain-containing protein [Bacillota bacterium]
MIFKELMDSIGKEKRRQKRVEAAQHYAKGMFIAAALGVATGILLAPRSGKETREDMKKKAMMCMEKMRDTFHHQTEMMKHSAAHLEEEAAQVIKDVAEKTEAVKKDLKSGTHEVAQDIRETAGKVADDINKSVK